MSGGASAALPASKPGAVFALDRRDLERCVSIRCSELWANWSIFPDPLSQAAFILHKAQIPQGKWDGAEFKRQLKSFMLRRIRNDFLNATLYVLPYCKDSANEFNVQFLAQDVHFAFLAD